MRNEKYPSANPQELINPVTGHQQLLTTQDRLTTRCQGPSGRAPHHWQMTFVNPRQLTHQIEFNQMKPLDVITDLQGAQKTEEPVKLQQSDTVTQI